MLRTLPRRKIREVVAEQLKSYIAREGLAPGDRLPTETELATQFGVSRLSLREATKALEFLGIVEAKTGVGLTVGQFNLERMTDHLGFHPALNLASATELVQSRIVIETGALVFAGKRMADEPVIYDRLNNIVDRFRAARELQTWIELDIEFHRTLLTASGLTPLVAFSDLLQVFFQRFRDSVKKAEWKSAIASHQRIVDFLRDQNIDSACDELRSHIESHLSRAGVKE